MKIKIEMIRLGLIAAFMAIIGFSGLTFAAEVIVDNGTSGTVSQGTWHDSGGANPYGSKSEYSNEAGATYTYRLSRKRPIRSFNAMDVL